MSALPSAVKKPEIHGRSREHLLMFIAVLFVAGLALAFQDDGVLPNGGSDGGHHNEATAAAANMAIMAH